MSTFSVPPLLVKVKIVVDPGILDPRKFLSWQKILSCNINIVSLAFSKVSQKKDFVKKYNSLYLFGEIFPRTSFPPRNNFHFFTIFPENFLLPAEIFSRKNFFQFSEENIPRKFHTENFLRIQETRFFISLRYSPENFLCNSLLPVEIFLLQKEISSIF